MRGIDRVFPPDQCDPRRSVDREEAIQIISRLTAKSFVASGGYTMQHYVAREDVEKIVDELIEEGLLR